MKIAVFRPWNPALFRRARHGALCLAALLGSAWLAAGCDTYYIAPPSTSITLSSAASSLVITTVDSNGQNVPNTMQFTGVVSNNKNTNVLYSVGYDGNYVPGGDNVYGTIDSAGVYTAPAVLPTPNTITVQAVAQADTTQRATATITLLNPPANVTNVSPAVVTAGQSYTLTLTGTDFSAGAVIQVSGAQLGAPDIVSDTEIQVPAQITSPGLLTVSVVNPNAAGIANTAVIRSQPSAPPSSSAIAVVIGRVGESGGSPVTGTKAYVPVNGNLDIVNLDSGRQMGSVLLPANYHADLAAADPAHDQVVVASRSANVLQIVNTTTDQIAQSLTVPVSTSVTVDGSSCEICAMMVDSSRSLAVLDTGNGYFTVDLTTGVASPALTAPAAANFGYDPTTERIYAPYSGKGGSGIDVIDLVSQTVSPVQISGGNVMYGPGLDSAAFDQGTRLLTAGDAQAGSYLSLNFNGALNQGGNVLAAASAFGPSTTCSGIWNGVDLDLTSHLGWFTNQGGCIAMATMASGPASGAPGAPTQFFWARVPAGPDGLAWVNTPLGQPSALAVYTGPDGHAYGLTLSLRTNGAELLKTDLTLLQTAAPMAGSSNANQVDPTQVTVNGQTVTSLTYIPLS